MAATLARFSCRRYYVMEWWEILNFILLINSIFDKYSYLVLIKSWTRMHQKVLEASFLIHHLYYDFICGHRIFYSERLSECLWDSFLWSYHMIASDIVCAIFLCIDSVFSTWEYGRPWEFREFPDFSWRLYIFKRINVILLLLLILLLW